MKIRVDEFIKSITAYVVNHEDVMLDLVFECNQDTMMELAKIKQYACVEVSFFYKETPYGSKPVLRDRLSIEEFTNSTTLQAYLIGFGSDYMYIG